MKAHRDDVAQHSTFRSEIESHMNSMLLTLGQIRAVSYPIKKEGVMENLGNIKLDALSEAEKIRKIYREELSELQDDLASAKKESEELRSSINEEKVRIDNLITQSQSEFNESQKSRETEFSNKLTKDFGHKIGNKVKEVDEKLKDFDRLGKHALDDFTSKAEECLSKLDGHTQKAGLVAQSIAQKGLKTEYENTAVEEKREANKWSWITIGVSAIMVLYVLIILIQILWQERPFLPESIAPKILLTAILVGIARWTAKLERRHADEARKYKQLSLELETIAPFIATLQESDQQIITKDLVPRYFMGRANSVDLEARDEGDSFESPLSNAGEYVKKAVLGKES